MASLIGKQFGFDSLGRIVGIAKDFNFNSLHYKIETIFLFNQKDWGFGTLSVKIKGNKAQEAIAFIQKTWQENFPGHPFQYQFLDDHFKDVYRTDAQITQMVGILAFLAILISCLGLFGLASYSAERRVKEIGVRKVLGASITSIVSLLSRHFIKLVHHRKCHCLAPGLVYRESLDAGLCLSFAYEPVGICHCRNSSPFNCIAYCKLIGNESSEGESC